MEKTAINIEELDALSFEYKRDYGIARGILTSLISLIIPTLKA